MTLFVKDSNEEPATTFVNSASTSDFNGEASASFTFELTGIAKSTSYTLGGIYPASASNGIDNNKNAEAYKIALPATQNASVNNYDPSAFIMVLKPETVETVPSTYTASFRRAVALNKVTLTGVKENISSVEITVEPSGEDQYLAGRRSIDLTKGTSGEIYHAQTNTITVNASYSGSTIDVWFCSWGVELSENDPLTVKMTSANNIYTHTINARAEGIKFVEGDLNTLTINMEHAVSMGSTPLPFTADFSGKTGTNAFTELEGFEKVEGFVYNASGAIRLAKSGGGGSITTPLLDLSKNFYVRVIASGWNEEELTLTVSAGDQSEAVVLSAVSNGNSGPGECAEHIVNFQPVSNSASVKFAAANGKRCYIKQIEICEGHAVPAPVLKATGTEEMDATGGEGSFTVTIINPIEGKEVGATVDADWIDIVVDGNQVTYTVAENTSEERREAVITLSYENAQSVDVVITQAGKPAEGGDDTPSFVKVTSAPSDWSGTYLIVFESLGKCWDGSLKGGTSSGQFGHTAGAKSITIANNTIEKNDSYFTIVKSGTNYTITSASGDCIGNSGTSAGLKIGSYTCTITLNNDNTVKILASDGNTQVLYNKSANYIRFYKTSNASNSGSYGMPSLYKLENANDGGETPEPEPEPEPETPDTPTTGTSTTVTMTSFTATSASMDSNVSYTTAKGGGTSAPAVNDNQIRLYQGNPGGSITITAKDGFTLTSVTIGSGMATKVAYEKGGTKSSTVDLNKDATYTVSDVNASSITFHCMGTDKNSRLYVNHLSVTYIAD